MTSPRIHKYEEERDWESGWWFGWLLCLNPENNDTRNYKASENWKDVTCKNCLKKRDEG